jgi:hypothetical protein
MPTNADHRWTMVPDRCPMVPVAVIESQVFTVVGQIANLPKKQVWQPAPHTTFITRLTIYLYAFRS